MEEKVRFVFEYEQAERTMTELCQVYGIARETGYVWLRRYRERGLEGLVELNRAALHHGNQTPPETEQAVIELRQGAHALGTAQAEAGVGAGPSRSIIFKVRSMCGRVRNLGGRYWRSRRKSRARGRLRYRTRFVVCWVFALETGCHLRAMKMACACDPSGLRARSRNLRELGTQGLVPAGSELFGGFGSCVGDDDSY